MKRRTIDRVRQCPTRKPRKDGLHLAVKQKIQKFYKREDISREMPSKRFTTKAGPAFLMQISVKSAYKIFRKENEDIKIRLTRFQTLRPERVKLLSLSHREFCLCPYCLNVKYKLLTLNRVVSNSGVDSSVKIADEEFLDTLLCQRDNRFPHFHRYDCVFGKCNHRERSFLYGATYAEIQLQQSIVITRKYLRLILIQW